MNDLKKDFEDYLKDLISEDNQIDEAMNYALLAGGKRLRPLLLLSMLADYGLDASCGFRAASALEMVHTYSLIHDDLPAMDNDTLRRGKPTVHVRYGEANAILAGDALLTKAFEILANSDYRKDQIADLVFLLADHAGHRGMVKGQYLDMLYTEQNNVTFEQLKEMEGYKTGKLLALPLVMACVLADRKDNIDRMNRAGNLLGVAFQVQDDILDYTSTEEIMGKSISDRENEKNTFYTLLGQQKAREYCDQLYDTVAALLNETDTCFTRTIDLIRSMQIRNN